MAEADQVRTGQHQARLPGHGRKAVLVLDLVVGDAVDLAGLLRNRTPRIHEGMEALGLARRRGEPRDRDLDDPVLLDVHAGGLQVDHGDRPGRIQDRRQSGQQFVDGGVL